MIKPSMGCTMCSAHAPGPGKSDYCAEMAEGRSPGKLIRPSDIENAPKWCPAERHISQRDLT